MLLFIIIQILASNILITKLWKNPTAMIIMFIIIIACQNILKRLWKIKLIFVTQQ